MVRSDLFQMYDFGSEKENQEHYGQVSLKLFILFYGSTS